MSYCARPQNKIILLSVVFESCQLTRWRNKKNSCWMHQMHDYVDVNQRKWYFNPFRQTGLTKCCVWHLLVITNIFLLLMCHKMPSRVSCVWFYDFMSSEAESRVRKSGIKGADVRGTKQNAKQHSLCQVWAQNRLWPVLNYAHKLLIFYKLPINK